MPKFFQIDNTLEFIEFALQELRKSLEMIHQTTCPHTS